MRFGSWLGLGGVLAALALWAAGTAPAASQSPRGPGKDLVARYRVPPEAITRYAALAAGALVHEPSRDGSLLADRAPWVGPEQRAGAGRNPYTLVFTVAGTARKAGEVRAQWQPGWAVREAAHATREVLMTVPPQAHQALAAGEALTLTSRSGAVSFRGERSVAPLLGLVRTHNLDIREVQIEVWSGHAPAPWWPALPPLLLPALAALGTLAWFAMARRRRAGGEHEAPPPTSSWASSSLPAFADALPTEPPAAEAPAEPAAPSPVTPAPNHVAAVTDALRRVLSGGGLTVPSVPDATRPPRRRSRR